MANFNNKVVLNKSALGDNNVVNNYIKDNPDVVLTELDKEFVILIYGNTNSDSEREALLEDLKAIKDPNIPVEKQSAAKKMLTTFVNSSLSESGKIIATSILSQILSGI